MRTLITNNVANCVGCNRCIRVCPIDEANVVHANDGVITVEADGSKCISCGACLIACHHNSREYEDDTERFFSDLRSGVAISMFAAPAAKSYFPEWGRLLAWLRQLGVAKIYDVSLGADICTWAHIRHIQRYGSKPIISQPCPAIVNYILMHRNELIKHLSPIHSPMLCTAVYMRNYEGNSDRIAALSPCIAKANEFEATGLVSYNVTFKRLAEYVQQHNIALPAHAEGFDSYEAGLGSLYSMPGGLKESLEYYLGKSLRIDKSEGPGIVYEALDAYAHSPAKLLPAVFDVLSCAEGCNSGTGCDHHQADFFGINTSMSNSRNAALSKGHLDELFARFDRALKLEDFIRHYTSMTIRPIYYSNDMLETAYHSLGKEDEASRVFDCGACGCDSCHEMAILVAKGVNTPLNCMDKAHRDILREHNAAKADLVHFEKVLEDMINIREVTEKIVSSVGDITSVISSYSKMIAEIEKIAISVNIIAINASIESARAGEHGRTFTVVADEIRRLAQSSDESAKRTKEASNMAVKALEEINNMVSIISLNVNEAYEHIEAREARGRL